MQLEAGYKLTAVGVLPEDWESAFLGDVATIRMCKRIFSDQTNSTGDIPFFKIGTFGGIPDAFIPFGIYHEYRKKYSFPSNGDILLSAAGTLGKTVVYDGHDAYFQDSNIVWLDINKQKITNEYLYQCYQQIEWASPEGSTISRLYNGIIRATKIPLPPLAEQRAIAEALSDVDALINALDALITKKRHIKQGTMQQLLTGKKRLRGFTGAWEKKEIGEEIDLITGFPFPSQLYATTGVRLLRGSNIKRGVTNWNGEITKYWAEITSDLKQYELCDRDIVIAMDGSLVGRSFAQLSEADLPALLLQRVARVRSEAIDMGYLKEQICSVNFTEHCDSVKTVTAIPHISPKDIRGYIIPIPPTKQEQRAIAEVLSDMDAEITALEQKRDKTKLIKQGMMQELLTGKTRLIEN